MKILVFGGTGFIGQCVLRALVKTNEVSEVISAGRGPLNHYQCDITDFVQVKTLFDSFKPQVVFHLAGVPIIREVASDPVGISRTNILGTHNLLANCPRHTRFIFTSSAAVYGDLGEVRTCDEDAPVNPNSVYGATKAACEALIRAYANQNKLSATIFRLVANVGGNATHGVLLDLYRKLKSVSYALEVLGDRPGSSKPFIHVRDCADFIVREGLNTPYFGTRTINLSSDSTVTVEEIAQLLMATTGVEKPIKWMGEAHNWQGDNRVVRVCNKRAKALGWTPRYPTSSLAIHQAIKELEGEACKVC